MRLQCAQEAFCHGSAGRKYVFARIVALRSIEMKLHTKLTLVLLGGLIVVVSGVQIMQYRSVTTRLGQLSDKDVALLRQREETAARNVCASIEQAVSGSLERGEMEKFGRLLQQQKSVKGLLEFSLFDREGTVSHSSETAAVGRKLPAELKTRFAGNLDEYTSIKDGKIEIYRPQAVTADCTRCHTEWKTGEQGGATYFAFSTAALDQADKDAAATITSTKNELSRNSAVAVISVVAVLATSVFLLVRKLISKPLSLFAPLLTQFESGHGDLTQRIRYESKDEIGTLARLFNSFLGDLQQAIGQSRQSALAVGDGATTQASAVEETSAAVTEIASTVKRSAENAQQANDLMRLANKGVSVAHTSMQEVSVSMQEVATAAKQIGTIVRTINEVAAKTNMLAINAAVEAARAGEAGAGFSVVAEDVRRLAKQSAEAAGGIEKIVDVATEKIQKGTSMIGTALESFNEVSGKSNNASTLMAEIARDAQEQAAGIEQISKAISSIDESTQKNAHESQELIAAMAAFQTEEGDTAA
jgi:methyl-accepting chemotaxis protein